MRVLSIFPSPVYVDNFFPDQELIAFLDSAPHQHISTKAAKHAGVYSADIQILRSSPCCELREFILESSLMYARNYLGYNVDKLTDVLSWVSKKRPDEEHIFHTHPNSFISGVFYYTNVTRQTPIVFQRPFSSNSGNYEIDIAPRLAPLPPTAVAYTQSTHAFLPCAGDLIMFPSHLAHSVPRNQSNTIRTSLAFNLLPVGQMGDAKSLTQFRYMDVQ